MAENSIASQNVPHFHILMMHPSLEDKGGVVSFCQVLMKNMDSYFQAEYFIIGNRPWNKNPLRRVSFFFHDVLSLKKKLARERYDLIQLNPSLKILSLLRDSFYLLMIDKLCPGKTAVMFHGWDENLTGKILRHGFYRKLFQRIYEKASFILVLCTPFKQQLIQMGVSPHKVGVITTMYERGQVPADSRRDGADHKFGIIFMARLIKEKGVFLAAEVGRLLVQNGQQNFRLTFAGDGPELKRLKRYIDRHHLNDHLLTAGYVTGERKRDMLSHQDLFLYPSYDEGCPIVLLEAMGSGLAIISTPAGAIPEVVEDKINGLIIGEKDPLAFYQAVIKVMADRGLLKSMQAINRKKAEELYEAAIVTRKIESVYLSIIGGKDIASASRFH